MNKPAPLSQRQYEYMQRCMISWFNVAEGGKRGGKNVLAGSRRIECDRKA